MKAYLDRETEIAAALAPTAKSREFMVDYARHGEGWDVYSYRKLMGWPGESTLTKWRTTAAYKKEIDRLSKQNVANGRKVAKNMAKGAADFLTRYKEEGGGLNAKEFVELIKLPETTFQQWVNAPTRFFSNLRKLEKDNLKTRKAPPKETYVPEELTGWHLAFIKKLANTYSHSEALKVAKKKWNVVRDHLLKHKVFRDEYERVYGKFDNQPLIVVFARDTLVSEAIKGGNVAAATQVVKQFSKFAKPTAGEAHTDAATDRQQSKSFYDMLLSSSDGEDEDDEAVM